MNKMEKLAASNGGELPYFTWPGGYEIFYFCEDGGVLCFDCANGENHSDAYYTDLPKDGVPEPQWHIVEYSHIADCDTKEVFCSHCGRTALRAHRELRAWFFNSQQSED